MSGVPIEKIIHVARALARAQDFHNAEHYERILAPRRATLEKAALAAIIAAAEFDRGEAVEPARPAPPEFELTP
jgi:hypothetical protein